MKICITYHCIVLHAISKLFISAPYYPSKCQYKSAVWYTNDNQRISVEKKVEELSKGGERKVYVDIKPINAFYRAEEYHQDFLEKQTGARAPIW